MRVRSQAASICIGVVGIVGSLSACTESKAPLVERIPTYHEDIAPILATHCAMCHLEGGIGPFTLGNYEDARTHAEMIRTATEKRSMPPFVLDNSGSCQTYREARWLTDEQIDMIGRWVEAGSPEGDPAKEITITPPILPQLPRVDKTIDMGTSYTPDAKIFDDYRCFLVDPGLTEDIFITAFDVHPGEPKMLHHLTLFSIDTESAENEAMALDAAEDGPGYSCIDSLRIQDTRWLVGIGPGSGALMFPEGTGLRMHKGRKALLQIHYNQENGLAPDRTKIDMMIASQVEREAVVQRVANTNLFLPPKQKSVAETATYAVPLPVTLWGLWPHMHKLGVSLRVTDLQKDGKETCVANADRYNFHWQGFAHYDNPVSLEAGDKLRITCTYDTLGRDDITSWGQGTTDEMCIAFFYLTQD